MSKNIWFMEGLSSQKDIISGVNHLKSHYPDEFTIFASHRERRNEILSLADHAYLEPQQESERLAFIEAVVRRHAISVIHSGKHGRWFEANRAPIEALGVRLTTGARSAQFIELADNKVSFAEFMTQHGLPAVPSLTVVGAEELCRALAGSPFGDVPLCIKPVRGIYGEGFWRFDPAAGAMIGFASPEKRRVHPDIYLHALAQESNPQPMVLMPYLPGPEYSVDILAEQGRVIAAVARRKEGAHQYLENAGEAYELGMACAGLMQADGIVNVQTRNDRHGRPLLLEINLRPSGGVGYTRFSGVNLPGLFALRQSDTLGADEAAELARTRFAPAVVRSATDVQAYDTELPNLLQL